ALRHRIARDRRDLRPARRGESAHFRRRPRSLGRRVRRSAKGRSRRRLSANGRDRRPRSLGRLGRLSLRNSNGSPTASTRRRRARFAAPGELAIHLRADELPRSAQRSDAVLRRRDRPRARRTGRAQRYHLALQSSRRRLAIALEHAAPLFDDLPDDVKDQIAIHEAGHAFMAVKLGLSIDEVSIGTREMLTKGFSDGGVTISAIQRRRALRYDRSSKAYTKEAAERDYAERQAMVSTAGHLAECVWTGRYMKNGDNVDKRAIEEVLRPHYPTDSEFQRANERLR